MRILLSYLIICCVLSCSKDKKTGLIRNGTGKSTIENNTLLLLKVDLMTQEFEGGTELTIKKGLTYFDSLPIRVDYDSPSDFGNVTLFYDPTNDTLFDGSLVWMGTGAMTYPKYLKTPGNFDFEYAYPDLPESSRFQRIRVNENYDISDYYVSDIPKVWQAIDHYEIVNTYLKSGKKIGLFLYTPSLGAGDPNEWDWIVIMSK